MARTHPVIHVLYKIRNLVAYTMDNLHHFCRRTVISGFLHYNEKNFEDLSRNGTEPTTNAFTREFYYISIFVCRCHAQNNVLQLTDKIQGLGKLNCGDHSKERKCL